jgi:GT2 family glycosyltransferase
VRDDIEGIHFPDDGARLTEHFYEALLGPRLVIPEKTILTGVECRGTRLIRCADLSFWGHQDRQPRRKHGIHGIVIVATVFPAALFWRAAFDEHLVYGSEEADMAAQAWALGYSIRLRPKAVIVHERSPTGRTGYSAAAEVSRFYSTYKRYRWIERRPCKASLYREAVLAHTALNRVRHGRWAELAEVWHRWRAANAVIEHERYRRTHQLVDRPLAARPRRAPLTVSVVVPSYRRPADLGNCLRALAAQSRPPDQVVVVVRESDRDTRSVAETFVGVLPLQLVTVEAPGVIAALNRGVERATGEIIAFTDDDASPRVEWLAQIERDYVRDAGIGGLGGRDVVEGAGEQTVDSSRVGRVEWFGRVLGNHHRGVGVPRYVDFLKGVNMSFARDAISGVRLDTSLRGTGAQVHWEMRLCSVVRSRGWPLIYDPSVIVDHRASGRPPGDERGLQDGTVAGAAGFNETRALLTQLSGWRRGTFLVWAFLVGNRGAPGIIQMLRREPSSWVAVKGAIRGRSEAIVEWWRAA